jgi:hypothetical protein
MKRYGYAERGAEGWRLRGLLEAEAAEPGALDAVMMSRLDFEVKMVDLPAAAAAEVDGFLRYRLRSLYPGNPEDTVFDWQPMVAPGGSRRALLFITRREILEGYRQAAGGKPLFLPFTLIAPALRRAPARPVAVLFQYDGWIETVVRGADGAVASIAGRSAGDPGSDASRARELAGEGARAGPWIVIARRDAAAELARALGGAAAPAVQALAIEDLVGRLGPKSAWLFGPRKAPLTIPRSVRMQVLAGLAVVLALGLVRKSVVEEQDYVGRLQVRLAQVQQASSKSVAISKDIDSLKQEMDTLQAGASVDPYLALSELAAVLGPGVRIQSFTLDKGMFQLEAVGANPLALMEVFKARPSFSNVKLLQTTPVDRPKGQELFRITGVVSVE